MLYSTITIPLLLVSIFRHPYRLFCIFKFLNTSSAKFYNILYTQGPSLLQYLTCRLHMVLFLSYIHANPLRCISDSPCLMSYSCTSPCSFETWWVHNTSSYVLEYLSGSSGSSQLWEGGERTTTMIAGGALSSSSRGDIVGCCCHHRAAWASPWGREVDGGDNGEGCRRRGRLIVISVQRRCRHCRIPGTITDALHY